MINRRLFRSASLITVLLFIGGCAATNDSELVQMLNTGQQIEIEIATPISEEQGEEQSIDWIQLDQLTTYSDFRSQLDDIMKITTYGQGSKNGICYVNLEGQQEGNSTLYYALMNRKFIANFYENDSANLQIQQIINSVYTDVEESEAMVAAINAYWNLLPDSTPNYFNGSSTISRLEAMSLLARAGHQVTDEVGDADFTAAVGQSDFTDLASLVQDDSYLTLYNKSLNESTASGTITRGEYIYMLVSNVFGQDRLSRADLKKASFNDCKDAGDIASQQKVDAEDINNDFYESFELKFALDNPDDGCPTRMFRGLAVAQELGIISGDTRWDEGLTKEEAIQLYIDTVQAYAKETGYATDSTGGAGDNTGEVVEAQKPIEMDTESSDNIGGEHVEANDSEEDNLNVSESDGTIESEYQIEPVDETVFYAIQKANLRNGPGTTYDIVGGLTYAQEIIINGKVKAEGDKLWWVLKTEDGSIQMVNSNLVSTEKPAPQTTQPSTGSTGNTQQPSGGETQQPSGGGGTSQPSGSTPNGTGEAGVGDTVGGIVVEDSSGFNWGSGEWGNDVWE